MAGKEREQKEIKSNVLLVVKRDEFQDGQKVTEVRAIDWIVGTKHYPQLEKREMYLDLNGEWKMGKAKGFSLKDLIVIQERWPDIMVALGNKLPEANTKPESAAAPAAAAPSRSYAAPARGGADVDF